MTTQHPITATREKLFFTLSSLPTIRTVMLREAGAYDIEFIAQVWEGSRLLLCGGDRKRNDNLRFPVEMIRPYGSAEDGS